MCDPIYETVRLVRAALTADQTMLGFAGSPWTIATYMVNGEGSRDQHETRAYAYRDRAAFQAIIDAIVTVTVDYLEGQARAGAEAVQLFDSWAGSLAPAEFERWVIAPNAEIVRQLKARCPDLPIIGFPKGSGEKLAAYARETGVDAVGIDETIDPLWAARELPAGMPVQGNLDPLLLLAGGAELETQARAFAAGGVRAIGLVQLVALNHEQMAVLAGVVAAQAGVRLDGAVRRHRHLRTDGLAVGEVVLATGRIADDAAQRRIGRGANDVHAEIDLHAPEAEAAEASQGRDHRGGIRVQRRSADVLVPDGIGGKARGRVGEGERGTTRCCEQGQSTAEEKHGGAPVAGGRHAPDTRPRPHTNV